MQLSVIIPSYKEPYLQKTIDSLLDNSGIGNDLEIIAVLDGYWPETPIKNDPRVKLLHLGETRGMRNAINKGVAISAGKYIMRLDSHCSFGKNWDKIMIDNITDTDLWTARRFFLDPVKWEVMDIPPVDYEKLIIRPEEPRKFTGVRWTSRAEERKDIMIDETMCLQGSMWIMARSLWDKLIIELDQEKWISHMYFDQLECLFKIWQNGGRLMVNKNAWFAHKHRSFNRTHKHNPVESRQCWNKALEVYGDYYNNVLKPKWKV